MTILNAVSRMRARGYHPVTVTLGVAYLSDCRRELGDHNSALRRDQNGMFTIQGIPIDLRSDFEGFMVKADID